MKHILQTINTGPGKPDYVAGEYEGNCVQAAVASIFNLELEQVPHFGMYPRGYNKETDPFLEKEGSLWIRAIRRFVRYIDLDVLFHGHDDDIDNDLTGMTLADAEGGLIYKYGLGGIQSPRGNYKHTVVISTNPVEVVWDPSPHQNAYGKPIMTAESFTTKLRWDDFSTFDPYVEHIFTRDIAGIPKQEYFGEWNYES